ncbi:Aste57867_15209 [Aphanomyces stellatus]|uniref:Aste57867_15209 protein n=1 Tax=Aphanomyces stellatus TaxID=120398 RepID=A0A485L3W7_9STRA|nr:hypothetical protein As57867_015153 [Aphanomyces stellatus]VFT92018.1 Aste57867_15209 [Aphanomyces stellatus]
MSESDSEIDEMLDALGLSQSQRSTSSQSASQPSAATWSSSSAIPAQAEAAIVDLSENSPVPKRTRLRESTSPPSSRPTAAPTASENVIELSDSDNDTPSRSTRPPAPAAREVVEPAGDISIISINTNTDDEYQDEGPRLWTPPPSDDDVHIHVDSDASSNDDELNAYLDHINQPTITFDPSQSPPPSPAHVVPVRSIDPMPSTTATAAAPSTPATRPTASSRSKSKKATKPSLQVTLEASWGQSEMAQQLHVALGAVTPKPFLVRPPIPCLVPSTVFWDASADGGSSFTRVPLACRFFTALEFLAAIDLDFAPIYAVLAGLREFLADASARVFLVVEGMDKALIAEQRKNKTTSLTFAHFTTDAADTVDYLVSLTKEIALLPQADAVDFLTHISRLSSLRATADGDTSNELTNTWLRMLQMIPGMSEERAQRVVGHYPTMQSLLEIYHNPALSASAKEVLLADKLNPTSIEIVLSKRIYTVFTSTDPNAAA